MFDTWALWDRFIDWDSYQREYNSPDGFSPLLLILAILFFVIIILAIFCPGVLTNLFRSSGSSNSNAAYAGISKRRKKINEKTLLNNKFENNFEFPTYKSRARNIKKENKKYISESEPHNLIKSLFYDLDFLMDYNSLTIPKEKEVINYYIENLKKFLSDKDKQLLLDTFEDYKKAYKYFKQKYPDYFIKYPPKHELEFLPKKKTRKNFGLMYTIYTFYGRATEDFYKTADKTLQILEHICNSI